MAKNQTTLTPTTPQLGLLVQDRTGLDAVLRAVQQVGVEEPAFRAPAGKLGGCVACGHTVASHFDGGDWLGCPQGDASTVYVLVPADSAHLRLATRAEEKRAYASVDGRTSQPVANATDLDATPTETRKRVRRFFRARYRSTLHHRQNVNNLGLSPLRRKVLKAVHDAYTTGLLGPEVPVKAKVDHGAASSTLNWLERKGHIKAESATDE